MNPINHTSFIKNDLEILKNLDETLNNSQRIDSSLGPNKIKEQNKEDERNEIIFHKKTGMKSKSSLTNTSAYLASYR